jgi:hypothetical protein
MFKNTVSGISFPSVPDHLVPLIFDFSAEIFVGLASLANFNNTDDIFYILLYLASFFGRELLKIEQIVHR